jgi:hypothetical protein
MRPKPPENHRVSRYDGIFLAMPIAALAKQIGHGISFAYFYVGFFIRIVPSNQLVR